MYRDTEGEIQQGVPTCRECGATCVQTSQAYYACPAGHGGLIPRLIPNNDRSAAVWIASLPEAEHVGTKKRTYQFAGMQYLKTHSGSLLPFHSPAEGCIVAQFDGKAIELKLRPAKGKGRK